MSCCWNCGERTLPVLPFGSSTGRHEFYCEDCDVKWVTPEYWLEGNAWKDQGGFRGYEKYRAKLTHNAVKHYRAGELVDFSKPGSPGTPALRQVGHRTPRTIIRGVLFYLR
jgi:hypothetical protein